MIMQRFSETIRFEIILRLTTRDIWWLQTNQKHITVRLYDLFHLCVNWRGTKMYVEQEHSDKSSDCDTKGAKAGLLLVIVDHEDWEFVLMPVLVSLL